MSYINTFTNTFTTQYLPDFNKGEVTHEDKVIIKNKNYCFNYSQNMRYQGIRETLKFESILCNFIRANYYFNEKLQNYNTACESINDSLELSSVITAQIVHAQLQLNYLMYKNLTSYNSNWYW